MTAVDNEADGTAGIPGPLAHPADLPALRRRVNAVLIASQILGGLGVATGVALAAVLAKQVSGTEALSGLAPTATVIGTALLSVPLAALMTARGRRPGLVLAYLIGAVGAAVVVLAAVLSNFPLLLVGMAGFGAASSANLQARFAAADLAEPERRGRAISTVVWATTIGAVLGPNIAAPAGRSVTGLGIPAAAGPFAWSAGVFLVSGALVAVLLRPDPLLTARALAPASDRSPEGRSLRAGCRSGGRAPRARLALVTVAVSHTTMVSIMSMTPVALSHHGAADPADRAGHLRSHRGDVRVLPGDGVALGPHRPPRGDRSGGRTPGVRRAASRDRGQQSRTDGRRTLRARPRLVGGAGVRFDAAHRFRATTRPRRRAGPLRPDHEHSGGGGWRGGGADRLAGELRLAECHAAPACCCRWPGSSC